MGGRGAYSTGMGGRGEYSMGMWRRRFVQQMYVEDEVGTADVYGGRGWYSRRMGVG